MNAKPNKGLGRGLSALIAEADAPAVHAATPTKNLTPANDSLQAVKLPVTSLKPSRFQPRSYFNETDLADLAESIKKNGVVQPVIVRALSARDSNHPNATHELIAGERRWRASQLAGQKEIPAIVMELDDKQALEIALIENIQRQNLTAMEVADGYQRLIDEFDYTQEELADVIGKSRTQITNYLRLLTLPEKVKSLLNDEKLSVGHARALIGAENPEEIAETVVKRGLNVRQTEKMVKASGKPKVASSPFTKKKEAAAPISQAVEALRKESTDFYRTKVLKEFAKLYDEVGQVQQDPDILELESMLSKNLGMHLRIVDEGEKGKIVISYETLEELDKILRKLEKVASIG